MREIRRKEREVAAQEAEVILDRCQYGVLSTVGRDGQPYGVPLSYVYKNNRIFFHCALSGHKLDNIEYNPRVSFCVVGNTRVLPEKFSAEYESVVVFGNASVVKGAERHKALVWLLEKYCSDFIEAGIRYIEKKDNATKVMKIEISHISGKARR